MSYKAGFVGIIGQPNAGKSSLLNCLVGEKISIVTSKPQTTRQRILGLWTEDLGQMILVDAPGLLKNQKGLNQFLENEAQDVIRSTDVLLAVLNVDEEKRENLDEIITLVQNSKKPYLVVLNKTDLRQYEHRLARLRMELTDKNINYVEASSRDALAQDSESKDFWKSFRDKILKMLPEAPAPLFDVEALSPMPTRVLVGEMIREACFENLHQELPYNLAIRLIHFKEDEKIIKIAADIMVNKEAYKPMVIGKGGAVIKMIGTEARIRIEKFLGTKIFLELNVIVRENWFDNSRLMEELGYVVTRN